MTTARGAPASEETAGECLLKTLELKAERDLIALHEVSLSCRIVVYPQNGSFQYCEVEIGEGHSSSGAITRRWALKMLEEGER